jgi:hypothetical protein
MNGPPNDMNNGTVIVNLLPLLDETGPALLTLWKAGMDWTAAVNGNDTHIQQPATPTPSPIENKGSL